MEFIPHILGILALLIAGFTFFKVSGLVERTRMLEKRNRKVEEELKAMRDVSSRTGRSQSQDNNRREREPRGGQTTMPPGREPRQPQEGRQPQEQRQKQPREQSGRNQPAADGRAAGQGQSQAARQPQEGRQKQEPREPRQGREPRQPQEGRTPQEGRQPQEPRQKQPRQPQLDADGQPVKNPQQNQRRNEGQRRQPVAEQEGATPAQQPVVNPSLSPGMVGDDLLNELTQQTPPQPEVPVSRTRYAMIPEDGLIKTHQLQPQPDSDSYLEIDAPADGSTTTKYRFNVKGNQAFVISQGMDIMENAFEFEKPSNRMVTRVVPQGDGTLTRTTSGWKVQNKARIDFR